MATVLFALGFIGSGILAVPVLAVTASVGLAGLHRQKWGFSQTIGRAPAFYAMVALGTVGGSVLTLAGINPIRLLLIVAILNGIAAAPFLIAVMLISADRQIMGRYRNGKVSSTIGWLTVAIMSVGAVAVFASGGI